MVERVALQIVMLSSFLFIGVHYATGFFHRYK
jgi:hypothetical protein